MATFDTVRVILAADVLNTGTFTASYPNNRNSGDYTGGNEHALVSTRYGTMTLLNGQASFSFGTVNITITNTSGQAMLAGTEILVQLDRIGANKPSGLLANDDQMFVAPVVIINLGAPDAAVATAVCASQAATAALVINGTLAVGGIATFDVPRNVVAAWTNTAILTVTGTDQYGNRVVEASASGTALAGKKAFKTITAVSTNASITGATVGSGDVIGLPVALPLAGLVVRELQDGVLATAGATVAASTAVSTSTTGDVRGTYDPNAACDGVRAFQLIAALGDPSAKGVAQFAG